MTERAVCFFHGDDLDGHCGGAVVALALGNKVELVPISYDSKFPFELVDGRDVIMVDFSCRPEVMAEIHKRATRFTWLDHHITAIEAVEALKMKDVSLADVIEGIRDVGRSGCELAWDYYFPDKDMPIAVRLLGRWDVWDHDDPAVRPFQYSMRSRVTIPSNPDSWPLWDALLAEHFNTEEELLAEGGAIVRYVDEELATYAARTAFRTELAGVPAQAINRVRGGSDLFNSIRTPEIPLEITFGILPGGNWIVSLYSYAQADKVHCGNIARQFGGGGHAGAAGFIWPLMKCLPFKVPGTDPEGGE